MSGSLVGLLTLALLFCICTSASAAAESVDWWESATYYQIYPQSFQDSDGNGVGDLKGITSRLKYLRNIGVTAVWLLPIFESPMIEDGYDIVNFTNIDPRYGTLQDFDELQKTAHKLKMKVVIDFVPNESSDECEWFQKSIQREDGYDEFYVWADGKLDEATGVRKPPNNYTNLSDRNTPGSAWTWNERRQQYYFHQFSAKQPDFNLRNPHVRQRLKEIMEFWLDRGVDAFRIDAIPYYFEKQLEDGTWPDQPAGSRTYQLDQPENYELLYEWRQFLDDYKQRKGGDTRAMIGEGYTSVLARRAPSVSDGAHNGLQMPINLNLIKLNQASNAQNLEEAVNGWFKVFWNKFKIANYVTSNFDKVRLASRMGQDRVDLMTIITHALPGATITYYGEEIGMTEGEEPCSNGVCDERYIQRTPMQWDSTKNAGFSASNNPWLPLNTNYDLLNVQTQTKTCQSTLQIFKEMTKLKDTAAFMAYKEDGGFAYGAWSVNIFHILRTDQVSEYRVLANLGNQLEHVEGLSNKTMEYVVVNKYSKHKKGEKVDLSKRLYLMPYEAVVLYSAP